MKRATFTKLNSGQWGLRIIGASKRGDDVEVTKHDGSVAMAVVERVLWSDTKTTVATIRHGSLSTPSGVRP